MLLGQDSQLQSIEDVISGIDSLLKEIDGVDATPVKPEPVIPAKNRPFRAENELMPREFIKEPDPAQSPASAESFLHLQSVIQEMKRLLHKLGRLIFQNYLSVNFSMRWICYRHPSPGQLVVLLNHFLP